MFIFYVYFFLACVYSDFSLFLLNICFICNCIDYADAYYYVSCLLLRAVFDVRLSCGFFAVYCRFQFRYTFLAYVLATTDFFIGFLFSAPQTSIMATASIYQLFYFCIVLLVVFQRPVPIIIGPMGYLYVGSPPITHST